MIPSKHDILKENMLIKCIIDDNIILFQKLMTKYKYDKNELLDYNNNCLSEILNKPDDITNINIKIMLELLERHINIKDNLPYYLLHNKITKNKLLILIKEYNLDSTYFVQTVDEFYNSLIIHIYHYNEKLVDIIFNYIQFKKEDILIKHDSHNNNMLTYFVNHNIKIFRHLVSSYNFTKNEILFKNNESKNIFNYLIFKNFDLYKEIIIKYDIKKWEIYDTIKQMAVSGKIKPILKIFPNITKKDLIDNNILELCLYTNIKYLIKKYNITKNDLLIRDTTYLNNNTILKLARMGNINMITYLIKKYNLSKYELLQQNNNCFNILHYCLNKKMLKIFDKENMYLIGRDVLIKNVYNKNIINEICYYECFYYINKIIFTKNEVLTNNIHTKLFHNHCPLRYFKLLIEKYNINKNDILTNTFFEKYKIHEVCHIKKLKYLIYKFKLNKNECLILIESYIGSEYLTKLIINILSFSNSNSYKKYDYLNIYKLIY